MPVSQVTANTKARGARFQQRQDSVRRMARATECTSLNQLADTRIAYSSALHCPPKWRSSIHAEVLFIETRCWLKQISHNGSITITSELSVPGVSIRWMNGFKWFPDLSSTLIELVCIEINTTSTISVTRLDLPICCENAHTKVAKKHGVVRSTSPELCL
jgi:hypothetical protein